MLLVGDVIELERGVTYHEGGGWWRHFGGLRVVMDGYPTDAQ
jgi:hypothetical protein